MRGALNANVYATSHEAFSEVSMLLTFVCLVLSPGPQSVTIVFTEGAVESFSEQFDVSPTDSRFEETVCNNLEAAIAVANEV